MTYLSIKYLIIFQSERQQKSNYVIIWFILSQQPISAYAFNNVTLWLIWLNNRLDHFNKILSKSNMCGIKSQRRVLLFIYSLLLRVYLWRQKKNGNGNFSLLLSQKSILCDSQQWEIECNHSFIPRLQIQLPTLGIEFILLSRHTGIHSVFILKWFIHIEHNEKIKRIIRGIVKREIFSVDNQVKFSAMNLKDMKNLAPYVMSLRKLYVILIYWDVGMDTKAYGSQLIG